MHKGVKLCSRVLKETSNLFYSRLAKKLDLASLSAFDFTLTSCVRKGKGKITIFYSVTNRENTSNVKEFLESVQGEVKFYLKSILKVRYIPLLCFEEDVVFEKMIEILRLNANNSS